MKQLMNDRQMKYYNMGQNARAEGVSKDAAIGVFDEIDRAYWLAGWHDKDIEVIGWRKFDQNARQAPYF